MVKVRKVEQTDNLILMCQVETEIGQVWRQMGIMYGQLSNSIGILEKVGQNVMDIP